jgi:NADPH-dependent 2,4-dienoyl-CoA reductase/sulfur reductase-like enzyme
MPYAKMTRLPHDIGNVLFYTQISRENRKEDTMQLDMFNYVILGGGVGAGYAAQEFVEHGIEPGELAMVSADNTLPYDRPSLSKGYLAGEKDTDDILINPPAFYEKNGIRVFLNTRVTRVDLGERRLYGDTDETIQFNKLLIATGSLVRKLAIPGSELSGIYYLRYVNQSDRIKANMQHAEHVVVIGGGYIGMEVASVLAAKNIQVSMVFPEKRLMERFFTPQMSAFFQAYYEERGVTFWPETQPAAFVGDNGHVVRVRLNTGQEIPTDFVVAGIGVEPATGLFEDTGLHLDHGIVVNKYLETNRDDVFAAGDVANYYDVLFQKRRRIEHWDNAVQQARHAARMMTVPSHIHPEEFMHLRYFFSDVFDLSYEFWGDTEAAEQVIHRGDVNGGSFSVWWLNAEQRLDAAFVMNRPDEERELAPQWIRARQELRPEDLQNDAIALGEAVPS